MNYWQAALLGFIQGATEFLPVSSSGHLVLVQHALGLESENVTFNVALHAGTLLSILVAFRHDLLAILGNRRLLTAMVVATLPVIPVGLFGKTLIEETLNTPVAAAVGLMITATLLFLSPKVDHGDRGLDDIRLRDALTVGLFQAVAPAPGISRSGSTIFGGLLSGLTREAAAKFAFLIAIPALGGALVLYSRKLLKGDSESMPPGPMLLGTLIAFVVGLAAIKVMIRLVIRRKLRGFAWYCLFVGVAVLLTSVSTVRETPGPGAAEPPSATTSESLSPAATAGIASR
ncbi:MAG: undecaprenyl-diphosphate phosphatase [Planctomyces sp.]|nr:undecaprenyl-diphosphate phosphatase [Planctomyces sp.]